MENKISIPENFEKLVGEWRGSNSLHVSWMEGDPVKKSDSNATVETAAMNRFLKIEYTWVFEEKPQAGILLIGNEKDSIKAVWIDSWHNGDKFMNCEGTVEENSINLKGFYKVPDHPDWGWKTEITVQDENSFKIIMHNVTPEGEESLAVEADYTRQ